MFSVSDKYLKVITADSRDMPYRVTLAGEFVLDQSKIPNMKLTESASGSSSISIGTANSASLNLTLQNPDVIDYNDMLVEPESGLVLPDGTIEWIPLGRFWVTNSLTSNDYKTVTLTCADGMYHLTGEYESELTYPTTIKAVVNEILAKTGFNFSELDSLPNVIVRVKPDKMTFRDAIGYAAGCCGKNARFNREGDLEFFWYNDTGITIERESQYLNGMTRLNDKPLTIDFEVEGKQETYIITCVSDGSGGVTATPGQNVLEDDTVVLTINPFAGYELATISAVTDSGVDVKLYKDAEGGYTFVQPNSNVTVTASFRRNTEGPFELTVRAYDGGSISANGTTFNKDDSPTIYIVLNSGYELDRFVTTPAKLALTYLETNESGEMLYSFDMPQSDVTISAYFKESNLYYDIEKTVKCDDTLSTPGYIIIENLTVPGSLYKAGDIVSVLFAENSRYAFDRYEANVEMLQIGDGEYRFTMPFNNVSITAYFIAEAVQGEEIVSTFALRRNAPDEAKKVTITYTNPMIYEKMVETISSLIQGITYTPARVKHRGNPAFQPGDILTVPDRNGEYHTVLIMQQIMNFGGGMNSEFTSFGQTENQSNFSANGPITTQIKKEVKQSTAELEHRIADHNALVFAALHRTIGSSETKIQSIAEWQTEKASTIAKLEETASEQESKIEALVEWKGSLEYANPNLIKNSSGANYPDVSSNALMISSTNFAVVSGVIESDAITVTEDEKVVYVKSDNIVWGDGTFYATPRTDRIKGETNYTVAFEVVPDKNVSSINVIWLSDTEDNRKIGDGYVNSTIVGTAKELIADELQIFTFTFKTKPDDFKGYLKFVANGGEFKISKIKMELGSEYTGWIPYGEDVIESIASLEQKANQNEASIMLQAELETQLSYSLSKIEQRVTENEASIEMKVSLNDITGEFVIKAINDESTAKIKADNIIFEGQKLNIKVDVANIEGPIIAEGIYFFGDETTKIQLISINESGFLIESNLYQFYIGDTGFATIDKENWSNSAYVKPDMIQIGSENKASTMKPSEITLTDSSEMLKSLIIKADGIHFGVDVLDKETFLTMLADIKTCKDILTEMFPNID